MGCPQGHLVYTLVIYGKFIVARSSQSKDKTRGFNTSYLLVATDKSHFIIIIIVQYNPRPATLPLVFYLMYRKLCVGEEM